MVRPIGHDHEGAAIRKIVKQEVEVTRIGCGSRNR
jgi:hypothetical protein